MITLSSIGGRQGVAGNGAYTSTTSAVIGLTKQAAPELGAHGITVDAIAPAPVNTPMYRSEGQQRSMGVETAKAQDAMLNPVLPLGDRPALEPTEIADVAVFLARRRARSRATSWTSRWVTTPPTRREGGDLSTPPGQVAPAASITPRGASCRDYAKRCYRFETHRHHEVPYGHLQGRAWTVGDDYTIADVAAWGWADRHPRFSSEGGLDVYPSGKAWFGRVDARPTVARARAFGKDLSFKSGLDEETARAMFPSNFAA